MATVCCFCGQKLGKIHGYRYELEGSSSGAIMCWPCKQKKDALSGTEEEKRAEAVAFFEDCLKNVKLEPDVRELTQQFIIAGEEQYQKQKNKNKAKEKYNEDIESFLMTTTNHLEGYSVQAYKGIASSEVVMGTGAMSEFLAGASDLFGTEDSAFSKKLLQARNAAQKKVAIRAYHLKANAIVGLKFDYFTIGSNMIAVSCSGTAVVVTKNTGDQQRWSVQEQRETCTQIEI